MIPILFESTETEFSSNGLGRLADCLSCTVTEERNGIYECQLKYPITGAMYPQIREGRIIAVIHDDAHDVQPFDIYGRSAPINGVATFYAHHISYRLSNVILKPVSASTCVAALAAIPSHTYNPCPFTFWTDKSVTAKWTVQVPSAVRAVLGGQAGSILDVYGTGDFEFDRWAVKLHLDRGADNGVAIRYGVNLTDLTQDVDTSSAYTAIVPYWLGPEGELVTLPEGYVAREDMAVVPVPLDLSSEWEEAPTVEQLRDKATARLASSQAWLTQENIRISFVDLAHAGEYGDVAALQRVSLCDRVSVYYGDMDVEAVRAKVIRTVFNVLTEMYDEIELGDPKTTLAQTIVSQFVDAAGDLPTTVQVRSMLSGAVDNATAQITGALGGFVRFIYDANGKMQEIVIMDTDDIATAQKVWRWNSGGLGYSSNGYDGPYGTAITQDGAIVADYIASGTMDANLIRTGILTSRYGGSYWDLDTGVLMIGSNADIGGMSAADIVDSVGASVTGLEVEFAQSQDSAVAPTTGWSTTAPSWAAGWYIWQRTMTTTPSGVEYSEPTCISGRDGSGAAAGLNQATLYLYQRSATQPAKPDVSMTYTFVSGVLTGIPAGWSRTIPSGSESCWVTSAAAISSDTAVTLAADAWQDAVMMAASGAAVADVATFFAVNDSTIPPSTDQFYQLGQLIPWTDDEDNVITDDNGEPIYFDVDAAIVPTAEEPYVWTFQRTTYTDGTVLDSTKAITAVYGEQGVGVAAVVEQYYLSTSEEEPTGGAWSNRQPAWRAGTYIWTRTRITWTDDTVTTTDPILARAINAANEAAAAAEAKAATASAREQLIYRSAASGTVTMDAFTTWVTSSANAQGVWTTTRPTYSSAYPVLFVATQRQTVEQRSGTACSCTTPVIDQTTTVIDGGHISTGTIDAGVVNVTNLKAANITSGTLAADRIGAGSISAGKIAAGAITAEKIAAGAVSADKIAASAITSGKIASSAITADKIAAGAVNADKLAAAVITSISDAQTAANSANSRQQTIYRSAPSGTSSMAATTTWVTSTENSQNVWTTCRPVYDSAYPVLFIATQRRNVAGTVTCTTPVIDQTTTVIDGGHIITGSITAGKIAASAITAEKIAAGAITADKIAASAITSGKIAANAITSGKIAAGAITAEKIAAGAVTADSITTGRITDKTSSNYWDLDSGTLAAKNGTIGPFATTASAMTYTYGNYTITLGKFDSIAGFKARFAASGYSNVLGLDAGSGAVKWQKDGKNIASINVGTFTYDPISGTYERSQDDDSMSIDVGNNVSLDLNSTLGAISIKAAKTVVSNNLTVSGTKSRSVATDQYADRLLYCYETPSPLFGDVGEGVIGEDGLCYVALDAVFAQTVNTGQYQVFLQRYGEGDCWVQARKPGWFVVQGTPGLGFGWEIKAKQRDFDQLRLERNEQPFTPPTATYGDDAAQHIQDIMKERDIA